MFLYRTGQNLQGWRQGWTRRAEAEAIRGQARGGGGWGTVRDEGGVLRALDEAASQGLILLHRTVENDVLSPGGKDGRVISALP